MNKLASEAEVDRSTISKVEKNFGITELPAFKILSALQKYHPDIGDGEIVAK